MATSAVQFQFLITLITEQQESETWRVILGEESAEVTNFLLLLFMQNLEYKSG